MADGTRLLRFEANGKTLNLAFLQNWNDNFGDLVTRSGRLPGLTGGFDELGIGPAPGEIGTISASFALVAESKAQMTGQLDDLRAIAEWPKGKLYMQPADPGEGERWCWARLNTITTAHNYERHSDLFMRVQATFQVAYPRWERAATTDDAPIWGAPSWGAATWGGSGWQYVGNSYSEPPRWGTGATWGGGTRWGGTAPSATSQTISVVNEGNALALLRLRFSARVACPAGLVIERVVGGVAVEGITLAATSANETWDVDGRSLSVLRDLKPAYELFSATSPRWLTLAPGANSIRFTFPSGGGGNVKFLFNHTWI